MPRGYFKSDPCKHAKSGPTVEPESDEAREKRLACSQALTDRWRDELKDEAKLWKFKNQAFKYASFRAHREYAEDFASFAVESVLLGKTTNLIWLYPDFLRLTFGDVRNGKGKSKAKERLSYVELTPPHEEETGLLDPPSVDFIDYLTGLDRLDRAILYLHFKLGFTQLEVSEILDLHHVVVSGKIKKACAELRDLI